MITKLTHRRVNLRSLLCACFQTNMLLSQPSIVPYVLNFTYSLLNIK